ncbi:MAG: L,D-transpeptidase family protein [Pseudomonadales bacterium]|nr:L,D-transpeptidase family protein [Pseudomonadales bacterium]
MQGAAVGCARLAAAYNRAMNAPRFLLALLCLLMAGPARADYIPEPAMAPEPVDRLELRKSKRSLTLYRNEKPIRTYRVSLGGNPQGHKEREGDSRTPEGRYRLTFRNMQSRFFLSIQVDYPNALDRAWARRHGWDPGGEIMIHGLPNEPLLSRERYLEIDWTDGCIAVSNEAMLEIWRLTRENTEIMILP